MASTLKVMRVHPLAKLPVYAHSGDSGMDLFSIEKAEIEPGKSKLINTGIVLELPLGCEAQIRSRSGLALRKSVTVLNSPGTIDNGYRGEVKVILMNHGKATFKLGVGMRIAQIVIVPIIHVKIMSSDKVSRTSRGKKGFGSTGGSGNVS